MDSQSLLNEYCRQAQQKYANGEFVLHQLHNYGQIININITLPTKNNSQSATLTSGWMVYPDGEIKLVTVFAGWVK